MSDAQLSACGRRSRKLTVASCDGCRDCPRPHGFGMHHQTLKTQMLKLCLDASVLTQDPVPKQERLGRWDWQKNGNAVAIRVAGISTFNKLIQSDPV